MATTPVLYAGLPDGAPDGHTHVGDGASAVASGYLVNALAAGESGGATLDVSAPTSAQRVTGRCKLTRVSSGGIAIDGATSGPPAGGLLLKYAEQGGGYTGIRITGIYTHAALSGNSYLSMVVDTSSVSGGAGVRLGIYNFSAGGWLTAADIVNWEAEFAAGVGGAAGNLALRAWREGASVPAFVNVATAAALNAIVGPCGVIDLADNTGSFDSNTRWVSMEAEYPSFEAPTVTVGGITHTSASLSGSAPVHPTTGATHVATTWWVERESDGGVLYGPVRVDSGSLVGPHPAVGLPIGETGLVARAQYEDELGVLSDPGTSDPFATWGPPDAPSVVVSEIRRTTVKVTPSAYAHPHGAPQVARSARVRRISTDTVVVPAAAVALAGSFYLAGLPPGPEGAGGMPGVDPDLVVEVLDADAVVGSAWGASAPFQTLNLWESGEFVVHLDVRIERPEGEGSVMQSYRNFGPSGRNWIRSARVTPGSVDTPIGSGTVVLHRQVGEESLAPLMTASPLNVDGGVFKPALDYRREVEARPLVLEVGAAEPEPEDFDAVIPWRGLTDDIEWGQKVGPVTVPWRDYLGRLSTAMIREQRRYGSPEEPVDAFEVMQQIVDDNLGAGQFALADFTTGDRYLVRGYIPADVFVLEAIEVLAEEWGGKLILQVDDVEASVIGVLEPDREAEDPAYTVAPFTYIEVHNISTAGKNRRTIVRGRAVDKATGRALTKQIPAEEDVDTDPLVQLFGEDFMELREATTIDTQAELDAFTAAVYADVSVPPIPLRPETKFCGFARVNHVVRWLPNGLLHDEELVTAVLGLGHDFPSPGVGRTQWQTGGRPKAKYEGWTRRGTDIGGIGKRPSAFDVDVEHDPVGTARLTVGAFNSQVDRWSVWSAPDNGDDAPLDADGNPLPRFLVAENVRPQQRVLEWAVRDGTQNILLRAYATDGTFTEVERTLEVTGVDSGEGEAPTGIPATPRLTRGAVIGALQQLTAAWINTRTDLVIEIQYWSDGEEGALLGPLAEGTASHTVNLGTPVTVKARLRYVDEPSGLPGPWSTFSPEILLMGGGL